MVFNIWWHHAETCSSVNNRVIVEIHMADCTPRCWSQAELKHWFIFLHKLPFEQWFILRLLLSILFRYVYEHRPTDEKHSILWYAQARLEASTTECKKRIIFKQFYLTTCSWRFELTISSMFWFDFIVDEYTLFLHFLKFQYNFKT